MSGPEAISAAELAARLTDLTVTDERRLEQRLAGARRMPDAGQRNRALADIAGQLATAEARIARRRAAVPTLHFPPELPVSDRVDDLAATIAARPHR